IEVPDRNPRERRSDLLRASLGGIQRHAEGPSVVSDQWILQELPEHDPSRLAVDRPERDFELERLAAELRGVLQVPPAVAASVGIITARESPLHPDDKLDLRQRIADPVDPAHVRASVGAGRLRDHQVSVLGHPEEAEVDLAEQRATLEQEVAAEPLA